MNARSPLRIWRLAAIRLAVGATHVQIWAASTVGAGAGSVIAAEEAGRFTREIRSMKAISYVSESS